MNDLETVLVHELEHLAVNAGCIADNLGRIATAMEKRLLLEYPPKKQVRQATITHVQTDEEALLAEQGHEGAVPIDRWLDIGTRERAFSEDGGPTGVQSSPARGGTGKTGS